MSKSYVPVALRERVADTAQHRCGYCLTSEKIAGFAMHIEHIIPKALGGETVEENLWLACPTCNGHKGTKVEAIDILSNEIVSLFNPRDQNWFEHFEWSNDGIFIIGITAIGRATVEALHLNNKYIIPARRLWVTFGEHPPK
ncbi:HNH endonuclease signature motif containing protein [Anaerolineales bacterium HSG6]|nr:HNH endonuclease signature motif containing protein [Anaerolineales bacterium HSG6]MDM8531949.1 HNH endonuclease signature motif containing protein [Anaerolineales bacterium HSG25]